MAERLRYILEADLSRFSPQVQAAIQDFIQLDDATERVAVGGGKSSAAMMELARGIEDFSTGGLRGALNNLNQMAVLMGAGGGLLIGITGATVALSQFGDDLLDWLDPGLKLAQNLKGVFAEMIELDFEQVSFGVKPEELDGLIQSFESQLQALDLGTSRAGLNELNPFAQALPDYTDSLFGFFGADGAQARRDDRRRLTLLVDQFKNLRDIYEATNIAADTLEAEGLTGVTQGAEDQREQTTLLEDATTALLEAQREYSELTGPSGPLIAAAQLQAETLERQIELRQQALQYEQQAIETTQALGQSFQDLSTIDVAPIMGLLSGGPLIDPDLGREPVATTTRAAFREIEAEYRTFRQGIEAEAAKFDEVNRGITQALQTSLVDGLGYVAEGMQEGFDGILRILGNLATDVGQVMIGFGFAGLGIEAFSKGNPAAAFTAGAILLGLGAALRSSVQDAVSTNIPAFGASGSGFATATNTIGVSGQSGITPQGLRSALQGSIVGIQRGDSIVYAFDEALANMQAMGLNTTSGVG